jgi:V/A-type H+/Na+-transporting ATPase subunit K
MDALTLAALGKCGAAAAIALAAVGSAVGTGIAGMASIGAWKKCYLQNKAAPFMLLIFIGAPLSQTIYGMILMNAIYRICNVSTYLSPEVLQAAKAAAQTAGSSNWMIHVPVEAMSSAQQALSLAVVNWPVMITVGVLGGAAMAMSALWQGKTGASGADALSETGKSFGNYLMAIGVVETVALFVLVFVQTVIK